MTKIHLLPFILLFFAKVAVGQSFFPDTTKFKRTKTVGYEGPDTNNLKYKVTYYYKYNTKGWLIEMNGYDTTTKKLIDWQKNNYVMSGDTTFETGTTSEGNEINNCYIKKKNSETMVLKRKNNMGIWQNSYKKTIVDSAGYRIIDSTFQTLEDGTFDRAYIDRTYYRFSNNNISDKIVNGSGKAVGSKNFSKSVYNYNGIKLKTIHTTTRDYQADTLNHITINISTIVDNNNSTIDSTFDQNKTFIYYKKHMYNDSGHNLEIYRKNIIDTVRKDEFYIKYAYDEKSLEREFIGFYKAPQQAFKVVTQSYQDVTITNTISKNNNNTLNFYPLPANDYLNISTTSDAKIKSISIRNQLGVMIHYSEINDMSFLLNTSTFKSGMYHVEVTTYYGISYKTIIKN